MISEEVGKILTNTQQEIKTLKAELEQGCKSKEDYQLMYFKLKEQLNKFEEKIQNNVENIMLSEMVNNDQTLNRLPLIKPSNNNNINGLEEHLSQSQVISNGGGGGDFSRRQQYAGVNSNTVKTDFYISVNNSAKFDTKQLANVKQMNKLLVNPASKITQNLLKEKLQLSEKKNDNASSTHPGPSKQAKKQKLISSKVTKPNNILPKEIRNNPFAIPPITEKDIKQGIMNLINRGLIPKDVDLTPAFKRGAPPIQMNKIKFHEPKPQPIQNYVSVIPSYNPNYRYENELKMLPKVTNKKQTSNKIISQSTSPDTTPIQQQPKRITQTNKSSMDKIKLKLEDAKTKDYEEVLDIYSLHQFIIRRGKTLTETPEFISYKRTYFGLWANIEKIIKYLENLLGQYDIKMAYIDGKKLAALAEITDIKPTVDELLECVINHEDVRKIIKAPKQTILTKNPNADNLAAVTIQAYFRMYKCKKAYKNIQMLVKRVSIIQKAAKNFLKYKSTLSVIKMKRGTYKHKFDELNKKFKSEWNEIKQKRRIEIHIPSLSYDEDQRLSMEKYLQRQNTQISRLFSLKDPLVDVIYIAPFELPSEIVGYYSKVFELGGLENNLSRFQVIHPENITTFPNHFKMSRVLLYSPKALKKLKQLIKGKIAYIVPGVPSDDDIELSAILEVPLYSGDPSKNALYSTKSGAKKVFNMSEVPTPPGSFNIYDEVEFISTLTKLIAYNLDVNKWIFKIDNEFNGRGHASFSIDQIKSLTELRKRNEPVTEDLINNIHEIISKLLPHKIKIAVPSLYRNYHEYIQKFVSKGGVIEAMPNCTSSQLSSCTIGMLIDPAGEISVIGSYDKIFVTEFVTYGYFFPQKSIPNINLLSLCQTIGKSLYAENVFGYITIDLITFPDTSLKMTGKATNERLFWAVDLNCYLTNYSGATFFFDFLMNGKLQQVSGIYTIKKIDIEGGPKKLADSDMSSFNNSHLIDKNEEKRCFMYFPFIYHPGLNAIHYKTFFHLCRSKSISYDLENKIGTTFILIDHLQNGVLGLFTIARYRRTVVKYMHDALSFIMSQAGNIDPKHANPNETRNDTVNFDELMNRVKLINSAFEKKQNKLKGPVLEGNI